MTPTARPASNPTATFHADSPRAHTGRRHLWKLYLTEVRMEFVKLLRMPAYSIPVIAFPVMFYLLFGSIFGSGEAQGIVAGRYMVATFSAVGVLSAAMFGFGVGVASERGQGWMRLKRVSPMPPLAYFVAKIAMALVFSTIAVVAVTLVALVTGLARFELLEWLRMYGTLMLGVFPFAALGLAVGYLFGPNSAPVILNLIYMPMAFASGLWMPLEFLPGVVQRIAEYLPTYHYAQLVLSNLGAEPFAPYAKHLLLLGVTTAACIGLATWAYFRDEGKTYG